jgi:hypothetical protein
MKFRVEVTKPIGAATEYFWKLHRVNERGGNTYDDPATGFLSGFADSEEEAVQDAKDAATQLVDPNRVTYHTFEIPPVRQP